MILMVAMFLMFFAGLILSLTDNPETGRKRFEVAESIKWAAEAPYSLLMELIDVFVPSETVTKTVVKTVAKTTPERIA